MSPEKRKFLAEDAKQLLDNSMLKSAFSAVADYLEQAALGCDPDDAERARRIVLSKQLLASIKREITRYVEDGKVAQIQIDELKKEGRLKRFLR